MKRLYPCLLLIFLALPLAAQPLNLVVSAAAQAKGDVQRPIEIEVTVTNQAQEASPAAQIVVTCTPKVGGFNKGSGRTLKDPLDLKQAVPSLQPGEKVVVVLKTPYESRNTFRGQRGTFRAHNIDPTKEIVVGFKAQAEAAPRR